jgi:hypothetical protein
MPRIIIVAEDTDGRSQQVVMEERVVAAHFDSDHSTSQLIERLGWAIVDAENLETMKMGAATHSGGRTAVESSRVR